MKIKLFLLFAVLGISAVRFECKAQKFVNESITVYQNGRKAVYLKDGSQLNFLQLQMITEGDEEAYRYMKRAKGKSVASQIFAYPGGFFVGYGLSGLLFDLDGSLIMLGIGAVCIGVALPIAFSADKDIRKGVDTYNDNLENRKWEISFGTTSNGVGLVLHF